MYIEEICEDFFFIFSFYVFLVWVLFGGIFLIKV